MKSLENYLNTIYTDFEKCIKNNNNLCDISSLNYQSTQLPDYSNIHIQQLYLLKYAYAYAYEYYLMYDKVVRDLKLNNTISVLSLGCGAMIDLIGLESLIERKPLNTIYMGVDKVEWRYKPDSMKNTVANCKTGITAGSYLQSIDELDADIYMFPKSISEFSENEINVLADCFRHKRNNKKRFAIGISIRNSMTNRTKDLHKAAVLEKAVLDSGYEAGKDNKSFYIAKKECGIKKYESNYNYPEQARMTLQQLGNRCHMNADCPMGNQCTKTLNRNPILKTKEICYKVMTFERRNAA